jgi:uncharacterized phiE125 gp8 family phage protein
MEMTLTEITSFAASALPLQAMKQHLRLGTGFSDDALQDGLIESYLRAAVVAIEGRIGKALVQRRYQLRLVDWRGLDEQPLPIAPISALVSLRVMDAAGAAVEVAPARYRLVADMQRPKLVALGGFFPAIPSGGQIELVFDAGFGPDWADVPPDLAQAVLLLAAEFYENRHEQSPRAAGLPVSVQMLIERWRIVRVLGGGGQ